MPLDSKIGAFLVESVCENVCLLSLIFNFGKLHLFRGYSVSMHILLLKMLLIYL